MSDASQTVRKGRATFLERIGAPPDGGYTNPWVPIRLGPVTVPLPNPPGRARIVGRHDIHHVLTGYDTDLAGEGEIAAWELASGCGLHWAAWAYNASAFGVGLAFAPKRMARAFARGRRSRNLYQDAREEEAILDLPVETVRVELGIPAAAAPTLADHVLYGLSVAVLGGALWPAAALSRMLTALSPEPERAG